jgi:RNA polymerase sigma-70 factor (ECF subfamily)
LSLVHNWNEADEIAQRVRVRLWEQFDDYDPAKSFGAWARTIAYYLILAERKSASRRVSQSEQGFLESISERFAETVGQFDARRDALSHCLEKLDAPQRTLIQRYYSGQEDRRKIAADYGRSFAAIRQSVLRIRNLLARCIEAALRQEEAT